MPQTPKRKKEIYNRLESCGLRIVGEFKENEFRIHTTLDTLIDFKNYLSHQYNS